jgi:hypothetical protein
LFVQKLKILVEVKAPRFGDFKNKVVPKEDKNKF